MSEKVPTSESSDGQFRPDQAVMPPGPVPGRPAPPLEPDASEVPAVPRLQQPRRGRRLAKKAEEPASPLNAEQRLLVLDAWQRSGLPAGDFAPLIGISKHTLYAWKKNSIRKDRPGY